jgi:uncharacterized membrane protein
MKRWIPLTLAVILLAALGLRLYGMNWDRGYGFHPDERSIYMQSDCMYRILTKAPGHLDCPTFIDYPETEPGLPSLGVFFDAERSALNPHWFPLGSIHLYSMVFIRAMIEPFGDFTAMDMRYAGRTLSALADVASILMLFLLGRRLFNSRVGLLAAGLMAAAVIHIQHSHFYRPETFIVLALLAAYWQMLNVIEKRRLRDWLFLGMFVGLMFSIKVSVLPLFAPLLLTYGLRLFTRRDGSARVPSSDSLYRVMGHAVAGGVVAAVVFVALTPYAIIDAGEFIADTTWEADIAREAGKMPYTIQYIGTTPFIYELRHSLPWALGIPLAAAAVMGVGYSIYRTLKRREGWRGDLLLLAWILPNFLLVGGLFEVKFQRYIFPIMPFLILLGSRWMLDMVSGAKVVGMRARERLHDLRLRNRIQRLVPMGAWALVGLVVVGTLVYAVAFMGVYQRPHPAVQASRWINTNVPLGTAIITDNHWDEGIPDIYRYNVQQIPIYEGDNSSKMTRMAFDLSQGEYLVFYSNRPYGSVSRVPERFPLSSNYYHRLFNSELGYEPERAFTSYPELFGVAVKNDTFNRAGLPEPEVFRGSSNAPVTLNLGYADENVANYDHPAVLVFRNVEHKPMEEMLALLLTEEGAREPGLMLSEGDLRAQQEGGTWSEVVNEGSWTNKVPVLAWLLLVELIYMLTLPLSFFIFRPLADRGIVLARILGILLVSYVAWLLASLHWVSFSRASMLAGLLAVGALSAVAAWRLRREMLEFLRARWRLLAFTEGLFIIAFLAFVAIRAANPDLWHPYRGGEKPMDFAYLNAILRSTYMPPYDPWLSGGYINYYYWGLFVVANLTKALGLLPSVAYNLAIPMLLALTVTAAFSIAYNVAAGLGRYGRGATLHLSPTPLSNSPSRLASGSHIDASQGVRPQGGRGSEVTPPGHHPGDGLDSGFRRNDPSTKSEYEPINRASPIEYRSKLGRLRSGQAPTPGVWGWVRGPVGAGLLAALMVAVIGNLDGGFQLVQKGWSSVIRGEGFGGFDFWRSSRMIPELQDVEPSALTFWLSDRANADVSPHITEFPYFSFLFADLHAHVIVIPFTLLVLGIGLALLVGLRQESRRWMAGAALALSLALGALWVINSWDYPSYLLLVLALLAVGAHLMVGRAEHDERVMTFAVITGAAVVFSVLAFLPFHQDYETFGKLIRVSKWQTPLANYWGIHGLFLFVIITFMAWLNRRPLASIFGMIRDFIAGLGSLRAYRNGRELTPHFIPPTYGEAAGRHHGGSRVGSAYGHPLQEEESRELKLSWEPFVVPVVVAMVLYMMAAGYWTAAFLTVLVGLAAMFVREEFSRLRDGSGYILFPVIIAGFGFLVQAGVEFVRIGDDIGRMNTLFKFYLEAWVLIALAASVGLWWLWRTGKLSMPQIHIDDKRRAWGLGVLGLGLMAGLAFWIGVRVDAGRLEVVPEPLDTLETFAISGIVVFVLALGALAGYMTSPGVRRRLGSAPFKALALGLLGVLVFSSVVYTALGTRTRLADRFNTGDVTLDGERYMLRATHSELNTPFPLRHDYDAIQWLRRNAEGSPVVLEAHMEQYRWGGRFAIYTGMPSVLGWPWHQIQQRGDHSRVVYDRQADVREAYNTTDIARAEALLSEYDVRYVVVGELERIVYSAQGLAKFEEMARAGALREAYRNEGTVIYEVLG